MSENIYFNDRLHFVVKVEELRVVFFDLGRSIDACFSFHSIELSFDGSIEEQVCLAVFLVLNRFVSERLYERLSLNCEMLPSVSGSWSRDFESSVKVDSLLL